MHHGTEREIRIETGLKRRNWGSGTGERLGWRWLAVAEIRFWRAEEGWLNLVKCRKDEKMLK